MFGGVGVGSLSPLLLTQSTSPTSSFVCIDVTDIVTVELRWATTRIDSPLTEVK